MIKRTRASKVAHMQEARSLDRKK